jgi:crossover junction endodeoxyribonuclease RuvC
MVSADLFRGFIYASSLSILRQACYERSVLALGIDPGTLHLGWGLVSRDGNRLCHVAHGVIHLDARTALPQRLTRIEIELGDVLRDHHPDAGSVENLFFHKDAQAASKLGHARGVVLLSLARAGIAIAEYPPARVKLTIAGSGRADKRQVALMVRAMLALDEVPPSDAADALALAITHLRVATLSRALRLDVEDDCTAEKPRRVAVLLGRSSPRRTSKLSVGRPR